MKKLLAIFTVLFSLTSFSSRGPIFMCNTDDLRVMARVMPRIDTATIEKINQDRPSYEFTNCDFRPSNGVIMSCREDGGRAFVFYENNTAKYFGSHKTAHMECRFSSSSSK